MKIVMASNTYLPHVGGVANSVRSFSEELRRRGHQVLIVCPDFPGSQPEPGVVRVPAIQNFNGTDFSVALPIPGTLLPIMDAFAPDIVHSHHPFLLGDTALRIAAHYNIPVVFTHHTMYEQYTHYVPADSPQLQKFAVELAVGYGNLCNAVIAPSESVEEVLQKRELETPIHVIPTGVDLRRFSGGDGKRFRRMMHIPDGGFVIGYAGRLAPEKNLRFLCDCVFAFMRKHSDAYFLAVGDGPSLEEIKSRARTERVQGRLRLAGLRTGHDLVDAYAAMDVFAFTSKSETQGMVVMEAMAAGLPVVALDASGARDVVQDGYTGFLIASEDCEQFHLAFDRVLELDESQRESMRRKIKKHIQRFSIERSTNALLEIYASLAGKKRRFESAENSTWWTALRRIEAEWEIWSNVAGSLEAVVVEELGRLTIFRRISDMVRRIKLRLSRTEWLVRFLGLQEFAGEEEQPGLILIQIDGLSRTQFEKALLRRRSVPFLRGLISHEGYKLRNLYSGLPSSTPSIQSELFYGHRQAVPSFGFYDREKARQRRMYNTATAQEVERRIAPSGQALLRNGSSYSNIYTGGARNSAFCASALGLNFMSGTRPLGRLCLILTHLWSVARIIGLFFLELLLAVCDCIRGIAKGRHLGKELKFIPARVIVCAVLRELITIGACLDAARGVPVIHLNFLGYDEQAHRRGPSSAFAHWALKGIDGSIRKIWQAANASRRRQYEVWIYSDHGQEETVPYVVENGESVTAAVERIFGQPPQNVQAPEVGETESERAHLLSGSPLLSAIVPDAEKIGQADPAKVVISAMGPLGHIYLPHHLDDETLEYYAQRLVDEAHIPTVYFKTADARVEAWNKSGRWNLPNDGGRVFGSNHPFLAQVTQDMISLCHHPDSGDLLISGWRPNGPPIAFPIEHGSHAGPGAEETRAFTLLPPSVPVMDDARNFMRPIHLRELALEALGRSHIRKSMYSVGRRPQGHVRIMCYNVHSCIGTDGRLSIARIAKVIACHDPDIICLQELDVARPRTGMSHQAMELARVLEMNFHFHPALTIKGEMYGDAILSRYPAKLFKAGPLPTVESALRLEPRGALWIEVDLNGTRLHVINTHLGLVGREREAQVGALVGPEWLAHPHCQGPLVLCGDMNAVPRSREYRQIAERLRDVQLFPGASRPRNTWQSQVPLRRIDHVFASREVAVLRTIVPATSLTRLASDHLPLIADLRIQSELRFRPAPPDLAVSG